METINLDWKSSLFFLLERKAQKSKKPPHRVRGLFVCLLIYGEATSERPEASIVTAEECCSCFCCASCDDGTSYASSWWSGSDPDPDLELPQRQTPAYPAKSPDLR